MTTTFECPSCGAPLQPNGAHTTRTCPYCGESVVVPASLRERRVIVQRKVIYTPPSRTPATLPPRANAPSFETGKVLFCFLAVLLIMAGSIYFINSPTPGAALPATRTKYAALTPVYEAKVNTAVATTVVRPTALPSATPTPAFATVVQTFGSEGTGPGHFDDGRGLALDGDGHIYVSDYMSGRVQRFDLSGKFLSSWIADGKNPLVSLAADRAGNVYAVRKGTLLKYRGADGTLLTRNAADVFGQIVALPDGGLLAWSEGSDPGFVRLNAQGNVTTRIPDPIQAQTDIAVGVAHFAVDGQGTIYAISPFNTDVFHFTATGKFVNKFAPNGNGPGQLGYAKAIAVDNQSRVYVSDSHGIQVFDRNGRYLATIPQSDYIPAMVFDDQNALWLIARNKGEVRKLALTQPATP